MYKERLQWLGTLAVAEVGTWLSWKQVATALPAWTQWVAIGVVAVGFLLYFPFAKDDDGNVRRLINVRARGRGNQTAVTGGTAPANTGTMISTLKGDVHVNGIQMTYSELKDMTVDASRPVVLPEAREVARAVASETAVQTIDERAGLLVQKVIEQINEDNPQLFARWDDPRFLAALTSAQRSFAETGDEDLADTLARLVKGLASQPIRTRREIVLRQAIEVAPRLTTEHINALAVQMYLTNFKINEPYFGPDWIIRALNTLLSHYYGRIPTSALDLQYMSSTGVCYTSQLTAFAKSPYQTLHERYANAMYPSFTLDDVDEIISDADPDHEKYQRMLAAHVTGPDDVVETDQGQMVSKEGARFRVAPESAPRVLARERNVDAFKLTPEEMKLRKMVLQRTLTVEGFKAEVARVKPELATFLDAIERVGVLNYPMHPVGFIIARHEIDSRAPQLAAVIDAAFDEES